jgi:hypothetical protein
MKRLRDLRELLFFHSAPTQRGLRWITRPFRCGEQGGRMVANRRANAAVRAVARYGGAPIAQVKARRKQRLRRCLGQS